MTQWNLGWRRGMRPTGQETLAASPHLWAALALFLGSLMGAQPGSASGFTPTKLETQTIVTCLNGAADQDLLTCMGRVSGPCLATATTDFGKQACATRESVIWDEIMNDMYATLMQSEGAVRARKLQASQRAWITWRDTACAYDASVVESDSGMLVLGAQCRLRLTAERTATLVTRVRKRAGK